MIPEWAESLTSLINPSQKTEAAFSSAFIFTFSGDGHFWDTGLLSRLNMKIQSFYVDFNMDYFTNPEKYYW